MRLSQKGFGVAGVIVLVVSVVIIGALGYFYVTNANKVNDESTKSNEVVSNEQGPYAGWQTYTDSKIGFTLRYPSDWRFDAAGTKDKSGNGEFGSDQFVSKADYEADNNGRSISFETSTTDSKSAKEYSKPYENAGSGAISSRSSKVNGYQAQTLIFNTPTEKPIPAVYRVFVYNDGKVVDFAYVIGDDDATTIYKAIVESIKFN